MKHNNSDANNALGLILKAFFHSPQLVDIANYLSVGHNHQLQIKECTKSALPFLIFSLFKKTKKNILFIARNDEEAEIFQSDLENIGQKEVLLLPFLFHKSVDSWKIDKGKLVQFHYGIQAIIKGEKEYKNIIIVTTPQALYQYIPNKSSFQNQQLTLSIETQLPLSQLQSFLEQQGYMQKDFVYQVGQYAIRGGIVDVFSFAHNQPVRIEYLDNYIETLRFFDLETQESVKQLSKVSLVGKLSIGTDKKNTHCLLDFFTPTQTLLCIDDYQGLTKGVFVEDFYAIKEAIHLFAPLTISKKIKAFPQMISDIQLNEPVEKRVDFKCYPMVYNPNNIEKDIQVLNERKGMKNFLAYHKNTHLETVYQILHKLEEEPNFHPFKAYLHAGFQSHQLNIALYTDHELFKKVFRSKAKRNFNFSPANQKKILQSLKKGDYVTHIDFGIGSFEGLQKMENGGNIQEVIRIRYADNDFVFLSIHALYKIAKYGSKDGMAIKLHKLGTKTWEKLKNKTRNKIKDIARDLIQIYAKRKLAKGFACNKDDYLQHEFEASFLFEETEDQSKSSVAVKSDMEAGFPMDRLICGDVGFGKTEIAMRAAFKAVCNGLQVAMLVPTTLLALQHYKTFKERFSNFPCSIDYVSRFRSVKEIKNIIAKLKEGKIDILIGTHLLLNPKIVFKNLGLMVIDEEQIFGVKDKEKIKAKRLNIDTLTLSATPIPRTLHFSLMGARDLSIIHTPPANRVAIDTSIFVFNEKIIQQAIKREIARQGQVFFVHNRIKDLSLFKTMIERLIPGIKVCLGHGQQKGVELEKIMLDFIAGSYDVLVSTSIIESGLDISNCNTIIINQAHMYGMSDLHQMRGRVGRTNVKAYCIMLCPPLSVLKDNARRRLKSLEEFTHLGAGFNIALTDLDIRGAGNVLGAEQSGFINQMGLDTYHKILDQAVLELKKDEFPEHMNQESNYFLPKASYIQIDTDFSMYIPDDYIQNVEERYQVYQHIIALKDLKEREKFKLALADRFGDVPSSVNDLIESTEIHPMGKYLGIEKLVVSQGVMRIFFIKDPQDPFFNSEIFKKIFDFVARSKQFSFVETRASLSLKKQEIFSIAQVIASIKNIYDDAKI